MRMCHAHTQQQQHYLDLLQNTYIYILVLELQENEWFFFVVCVCARPDHRFSTGRRVQTHVDSAYVLPPPHILYMFCSPPLTYTMYTLCRVHDTLHQLASYDSRFAMQWRGKGGLAHLYGRARHHVIISNFNLQLYMLYCVCLLLVCGAHGLRARTDPTPLPEPFFIARH